MQLRTHILGMCSSIIEGKPVDVEREESLIIYMRPLYFFGSDSAEVKYTKAYIDASQYVMGKTGADPDRMTVIEFHNCLDNGRPKNKSKRSIRR